MCIDLGVSVARTHTGAQDSRCLDRQLTSGKNLPPPPPMPQTQLKALSVDNRLEFPSHFTNRVIARSPQGVDKRAGEQGAREPYKEGFDKGNWFPLEWGPAPLSRALG